MIKGCPKPGTFFENFHSFTLKENVTLRWEEGMVLV